MNIVLDASVAAKWYLPREELYLKAAAIKEDFLAGRTRLLSPSIIYYEINNVLRSAVLKSPINTKTLLGSLQDFYELDLQVYQSTELLLETFRLATRFSISSYDAVYVALANSVGAPLYTADEKLVRAVSKKIPLVRSLAHYVSP